MNWWCATTTRPWDWTPRPFLGVWVFVGVLVVAYTIAVRHDDTPGKARRALWFGLGVAALWAASDWPIGPLGAGYLAWVHMVQYMLYILVAAPLLLLATPPSLARRVVDVTRAGTLVRVLCQPVLAAVFVNAAMILTHSPFAVDRLRTSQSGSFLLDMIWLFTGFVLWAPVIAPLPELIVRSVPARLTYLFLASSLVPMIPGGFLTFAQDPLYRIYANAPRVGFDVLEDQQMAGAIMKVGSVPIVWTVILVVYVRWFGTQIRKDRHREAQRRAGEAATSAARA